MSSAVKGLSIVPTSAGGVVVVKSISDSYQMGKEANDTLDFDNEVSEAFKSIAQGNLDLGNETKEQILLENDGSEKPRKVVEEDKEVPNDPDESHAKSRFDDVRTCWLRLQDEALDQVEQYKNGDGEAHDRYREIVERIRYVYPVYEKALDKISEGSWKEARRGLDGLDLGIFCRISWKGSLI